MLFRSVADAYKRDRPYNGQSMLVMALPHKEERRAWPNPIVFHSNTQGNLSPDPQKDEVLPDVAQHMVFNAQHCPAFCGPEPLMRKRSAPLVRMMSSSQTELKRPRSTAPCVATSRSMPSRSGGVEFVGPEGALPDYPPSHRLSYRYLPPAMSEPRRWRLYAPDHSRGTRCPSPVPSRCRPGVRRSR